MPEMPNSGSNRTGQIAGLGNQAKSLLPTPAVNDMGGNKTVEWWDEWTEKTRLKHNNSNGHGPSLTIEMLRLLPTPVASEGTKAPAQQDAETKGQNGQVWLSNVAKGISNDNLLPTPNTMEHLPARTEEQIAESKKRSPAGYNNLREKVLHEATNWGKFELAIRRWEAVIGRPSPAPTKPDGKDDQHRLSSEFTEWMMGLPQGWITDAGLKRNDELKACGNGVVPQQAEMALRLLLSDSNMTLERERVVLFPTPTVSDTYTDNLASSQQKEGSMHSVTLPQAVRMVAE
jgi:DNA (cytosine-5)-methyltransferase 1